MDPAFPSSIAHLPVFSVFSRRVRAVTEAKGQLPLGNDDANVR
jgi:hypothetical protein